MSTNVSKQNPEDQEIDLREISKKIGIFFQSINTFLFKCIQFFVEKVVVISILLVIGVGLGFYADQTAKKYDSEIIVMPNFGSNDYLYSKINLLNSKINERDTIFLQRLGFKDIAKINGIKIEPILDVYKFANDNPQNFEVLKLIAEKGDLNKIFEDKLTSKNYVFHTLSIATSKAVTIDGLVNPLVNYLNTSDYYSKIKTENLKNIKIKIIENDSIIKQIDGFLNNFKNNTNGKSNNLVYYNENSQLNDIIKTKDLLLKEQGYHRLEGIKFDKIIKDISVNTNIKNVKSINGNLKLLLPLLFIFLYLICYAFVQFYKNQKAKFNTNI